ncbi:MAG: PAS domain S-box protein [Deltaproteobacteria bacterium]
MTSEPLSPSLLSALVEGSPSAVLLADREGRILYANPAAERLFGRSNEELLGRCQLAELCPPGTGRELRRRYLGRMHGGRMRLDRARSEILTAAGYRVPVELSAFPLEGSGRRVVVGFVVESIRERVQIEERLARLQGRLDHGERQVLLAELAGTAAHELNQPLTSVVGYAELLMRRLPPDDPSRPAVEIILREAERMADLVRKIGKVNKYETKSYVGEARIVDLDRAVEPEGRGR